MSQKTDPTSLRISSKYKNFYSCWYSDYFYSEMFPYDFEIRSYIQSVCEQSKHLQCVFRLQNSYKRAFIFVFLLDTRGMRRSAEKSLRLPNLSLQSHLIPDSFLTVGKEATRFRELLIFSEKDFYAKSDLNLNSLLFTQNQKPGEMQQHNNIKFEASLCELKKEICFSSFKKQSSKKDKEKNEKTTANLVVPKLHQSNVSKRQEKQKDLLHSFLEKNLTLSHFNFTTVYPIRILQELQNADFLAGEIVYLLQKRVPFRQIQSFILRKVMKNSSIKGIRISCSGRVGGRSKKAQKSKTQSVQWGQTSLHVFSSKLDFSSKSAFTLFGKVGVKVWLCYK